MARVPFPEFEIELDQYGHRSRVSMNGVDLPGLTAIEVKQQLDSPATVTLTFVARSVNRSVVFDAAKEPRK